MLAVGRRFSGTAPDLAKPALQNVVVGLLRAGACWCWGSPLLVEFQPDTTGPSLEEKLQPVLPKKDSKPPQRLGGTLKKLEERQKKLAEFEKDDAFTRLPNESREAVKKYQTGDRRNICDKAEDFKAKVKFPFLAKTDKEYIAQEKNLRGLSYPEHAIWDETQLGKHAQQVPQEYDAVEQGRRRA